MLSEALGEGFTVSKYETCYEKVFVYDHVQTSRDATQSTRYYIEYFEGRNYVYFCTDSLWKVVPGDMLFWDSVEEIQAALLKSKTPPPNYKGRFLASHSRGFGTVIRGPWGRIYRGA